MAYCKGCQVHFDQPPSVCYRSEGCWYFGDPRHQELVKSKEKKETMDIYEMVAEADPQVGVIPIERKLLKLVEELGEFVQAYLSLTSEGNGKGITFDQLVEELADLNILVANISKHIVHKDILIPVITKKLEKWKDKVQKGTDTLQASKSRKL